MNEPTQTTFVHSPNPLVSSKRTHLSSTKTSLPKSPCVEELEKMAEDANAYEELEISSGSEEKVVFESTEGNKTLPAVPSPVVNDGENERRGGIISELSRIDGLLATSKSDPVKEPLISFSSNLHNSSQLRHRPQLDITHANDLGATSEGLLKAPPTPCAAITPVKVPSKPKSVEFRAPMLHLPSEGVIKESGMTVNGLDALERRLLAEVGTRKKENDGQRPDARSVVFGPQPINIPPKSPNDGPLNDSAISSLALAGEETGASTGLMVPELDCDDGDSDDKTHRGRRSSMSASSKKGSKCSRGGGARKEGRKEMPRASGKRKKDKGKIRDKQSKASKKTEAAKGRVTAWLGGIQLDDLPGAAFVDTSLVEANRPSAGDLICAHVGVDEGQQVSQQPKLEDRVADAEVSSLPNPRSSGFVPIGTIKHDTGKRRRFHVPTEESTVIEEANRVADIWSSSAAPAAIVEVESTSPPLLKDKAQRFPLISPTAPTTQTVRTYRRVSPPSASKSVALGISREDPQPSPAESHQPVPSVNTASENIYGPRHFGASPHPNAWKDTEDKYHVRSARGGRGGQVTAIASIWGLASASSPIVSEGPHRKPVLQQVDSKPFCLPAMKPIPEVSRNLKAAPVANTNDQPPSRTAVNEVPGPCVSRQIGEYKFVEIASKGTKGLVQSTSVPVPAVVSSSLATPVLSSTASLARPPKPSASFKVMATDASVQASPPPGKYQTDASDLAFGKAKLRDLIKKYQGQGA